MRRISEEGFWERRMVWKVLYPVSTVESEDM